MLRAADRMQQALDVILRTGSCQAVRGRGEGGWNGAETRERRDQGTKRAIAEMSLRKAQAVVALCQNEKHPLCGKEHDISKIILELALIFTGCSCGRSAVSRRAGWRFGIE
jgi:hypothetical protein